MLRRALGEDRVVVLLLTLLAAAIRLPGLQGDLWIDEIATLTRFVRLAPAEIASTYESANQHALYSLLAHASIGALGESALALRLPALLLGVATVPAVFALARAHGSRGDAVATALLLAVSYPHAYFSQNARGYTGLMLLAVVSTACLARTLALGRRRDAVAFALAAAAALYMHLSGAFVLAAQAVGAGVIAARGRAGPGAGRRVAVATAAAITLAALLYAPMARAMIAYFATADRDVGWRPSRALAEVVLRDAAPSRLALAAAAAAAPFAAFGLARTARDAPLVACVAIAPPLLALAAAAALGVGAYPRAFVVALPFAILIGVRGLRFAADAGARRFGAGAGPGARLFAALVALAAVGAGAGLPRLHALPKQDYTGALAFIDTTRSRGDLVAAAYVADTGARFYDPSVLSARTPEALAEILARGAPVWLLGTFVADMRARSPRLAAAIDAEFEEARRFPGLVGDGDIVVWRRRPPSAPDPVPRAPGGPPTRP
jgi:hypothetical protein